ncbi:MAG: trypsin-like peptidase domain-containing protein [Thermodesulfobacteriota bacterium]
MTALRYALVATLAHFVLGLYLQPVCCFAEDLKIRRAATRPPSRMVAPRRAEPVTEARAADIDGKPGPTHSQTVREDRTDGDDRVRPRNTVMPDVREVIRRVNQSVVAIRMLDGGNAWSLTNLELSGRNAASSKAMGYGSGFIVSSRGHIITNEHVLRNGSQIEVELLSGRKYLAHTLHKDAKNDLALIKIDAQEKLQPARFGDSDSVELGEWVVGIGNPFGIGQSIMIGIVSAKGRKIPGSGYPPLIQIDAAMNLGNSGGPLFNLDGEVIGINTILLWKSQGIGFSTPINVCRAFIQQHTARHAEAASPDGPLGPVADRPRSVAESFNPLAPPWKRSR